MSWPLVNLGSVATFINGDRGKNYPSKGSFVESGIPFINAGHLEDGDLLTDTFNYITEEKYDSLKSGKVLAGDILFCLRGSLGKYAVVKESEKGAIASSLVIIRPNEKITLRYLKNYLGSIFCKREIEQFENGAAQPNLSATDLKKFKISLPPLDEQKRIAAILDKADAIRRKRQQAIKLADDFLRSVFLDMFGDPVTNSKGLKLISFGSIAEFINGDRSSNYPSGSELIEEGILFLNTKNIVNHQLSFKEKIFISQEKFDSLSRGKLQRKDLVITLRGTLGSCAIFDTDFETGFINAQIMILRCGEKVLPEYLHALLTSNPIHSMLQRVGQGAAVPQLTATQLKALKLPVPTLELQKKFVNTLHASKKLMKKFDTKETSLLFDALRQKAFSGEL